ncbi:MAG TPA: hypothetical protein VK553_07955 [Candidatus Nitrosopolaris rasttigaisensis]|nr:hypothetical protein [Candidatus Nitrosopolaris rasttigaisensis]
MFHYLKEWHLVHYLAKYTRTNDYALNSGFVSSIDSSTEIENDEISPANFRHDLRKLLRYSKQDLGIYPLNLTSAGERNYFKGYLMERRIKERCCMGVTEAVYR